MMYWKKRPDSYDVHTELLASIVSLYLYMAKSARFQGREIIFIDRLLRSMFGYAIPLEQIESARRSKISVREAANTLNLFLNSADRIKIILNLISLAYHERSKIHVLGSVEIVELADLLRLDVNKLEDIYNLFEGNSDTIFLPEDAGMDDLLKNSMRWGIEKGCLPLKGFDLHFIMIESLVLVRSSNQAKCTLQTGNKRQQIQGNQYFRIYPESTLKLSDWELTYSEIWAIYRNKNSIPNLEQYLTTQTSKQIKNSDINEHYIELIAGNPVITPSKSAYSILYLQQTDSWQISNISNIELRLNGLPLTTALPFSQNNDVLNIDGRNYIINRHFELIEIPIQITDFIATDLWYYFKEGNAALKGISFALKQGSMMAIMGSSGAGKTTLLQLILGELVPYKSKITIDGMDLLEHYAYFQPYMGYVPQDDLLFANLTVYENLLYKLKLSSVKQGNSHNVKGRIDNLLKSVGLYEQRNMIVGDVMNKKLSGGQRRRLNIALELVMNPAILILDEPTSGLSTKDSENIVEFLAELRDQGKIILSTIHQPNATIFSKFDSVLLMDKGGVQVYFGDTNEVFSYFDEELKQADSPDLQQKRDLKMPEYFFDLIEYSHGQRIFPPDYWADKFRDFSFMKVISSQLDTSEDNAKQSPKVRSHFSFKKLFLLIRRNFLNKSRSKLNVLMTLFVAPLLALVTAFVLRGTPEEMSYSYFENLNSLLMDFIAIIIFIFIGLANSIDDILSEKRIIVRELKSGISPFCQLYAKHLVLFLMTIIQALLFYFVSALVLNMRGFLYPKLLFLILSGVSGYSLGLLFSSFIKDRGAIINILPLVIIPQIMFSGAVIKFSEMNPALKLFSKSEIPEFCHAVPSRWLFEGMVVASARINTYERHKGKYLKKLKAATLDKTIPVDEYMALVDGFELFEINHPESKYQNKLTSTSVRLSQGKSLKEKRNIFLSYQMNIWGYEVNTINVDAIASVLIIFLASMGTWIKLRFGYKR